MSIKEPNFQDEVKHNTADVSGIVIAKYRLFDGGNPTETLLDIRAHNDKIYYGTYAKNWTVLKSREDIEGPLD